MQSSDAIQTFHVTIKAWQRHHDPGEADWEQYEVDAEDAEDAEEKAIEKAKNHISRSIIDRFETEGYEVVEVSKA